MDIPFVDRQDKITTDSSVHTRILCMSVVFLCASVAKCGTRDLDFQGTSITGSSLLVLRVTMDKTRQSLSLYY